MAVAPRYVVTDEWFCWLSGEMPPKIRDAICKWCEFHGLDPNKIPQQPGIMRAPEKYKIVYAAFVEDETGQRIVDKSSSPRFVHQIIVEQGEAPPLPWPQEILDLRSTLFQHDPSR